MAVSPIAIQAGLTMPGASAYALPANFLSPVVPLPYEPLATYDWVFGSDYSDASDLISGAKLEKNILIPVTAGGTGYEASGLLVFSGGGATRQATGIWFAVNGIVTGAYITDPGSGYTSAPSVALSTSSGTGAAITPSLGGSGSFTLNTLALPAVNGAGLILPATETNDQTVCAVIKVNKSPTGSNVGIVFGTLRASGGAPNTGGVSTGSGFFLQGTTGYAATTRPGTALSAAVPTGIADGAYAFVAMSESASGGRLVYWGGPSATVYTATQPKTMATVPPKIAIGNAYYSNVGFAQEMGELIYISRSTTQTELDAVYARCKSRMSERGIVIY